MIREPMGAGEKVLTVLRGEEDMAKPTDIRCRAKDEESSDGRCEGEITINTRTGAWLIWCENHQAQEEDVRANGGPRVERAGASS